MRGFLEKSVRTYERTNVRTDDGDTIGLSDLWSRDQKVASGLAWPQSYVGSNINTLRISIVIYCDYGHGYYGLAPGQASLASSK